jgi:translation initiation factor 2 beta subunit (eIF-2beta)/eIF-5
MPVANAPATNDQQVASPDAGYRQCPICNSWDTTRHAEGYRVWFTCNRCGAVFG